VGECVLVSEGVWVVGDGWVVGECGWWVL